MSDGKRQMEGIVNVARLLDLRLDGHYVLDNDVMMIMND
jgi:hypothetical protein